MPTFLEGVESISLWCSLVVILPTLVLVLVAPTGRIWIVSGAITGTATTLWARAGRLWEFEVYGATRWLVGAGIITTFLIAFRIRHLPTAGSGALGLASGAVAGWLWQPCVGEHLAEVLNRAESERVTSLLEMNAYVVGLSLPAILIAAVPFAVPRTSPTLHGNVVRSAALAVAVIYGIAVAGGWYDDLVSELFRRSSQ